MNYFEAKVKSVKVSEDGKEKKVTESYLVDAMSLTEMEARTIKELEKTISGDFKIVSGKESNISEVFPNPTGGTWFKAKVVYEDMVDGKEKKITEYNLIESDTVENASSELEEKLSQSLVPFHFASVSESNIMDVFNYFEEN
jgi:hypothetical protein